MKDLILPVTFAALALAACTKNDSSSGTPAAPSAQAPTPDANGVCSRSPVSESYDSTHESTTDKWVRDGGREGFTILTKAPVLMKGGESNQFGSIMEVVFKNGQQIAHDDDIPTEDGAFCSLRIQLGNDDYEAYLKTKKYPSFVLTPRALHATTERLEESSESSQAICSEPKSTTQSWYEIRIDQTPLVNARGQRTGSYISSMMCTGHDLRLSTILNVFGSDKVQSVTAGNLALCSMQRTDEMKAKALGAIRLNAQLAADDLADARRVTERLKTCRANSVMLLPHCLTKDYPAHYCPTASSFYEIYDTPTVLGLPLTVKIDTAQSPLQAVIYKRPAGEAGTDLETEDDVELLRIDLR